MRAQQAVYTCSVDIRPEWAVVEQIPFASLAKLSTAAPAAEDVTFCGSLQYYDKAFDRITPKEPRPLQRTKRAFRSPSTSDDPVIKCAPRRTGLLSRTQRHGNAVGQPVHMVMPGISADWFVLPSRSRQKHHYSVHHL